MNQAHSRADLDSTFHTVASKPEVVGKYEILEEIGRGSMGIVYSAHDSFSDRKVAIKVANSHNINQSEDREQFRKLFFNEAHAASVLEHPSIIALYDAGVEGDLCYLVMEYVPGAQTLQEFCKPDKLLSIQEIINIIFRSAKALDYAHRQGITHRDIKPNNILFTESRDIRLSDFSIARITRSDLSAAQFDGFIGSPLYMSPEQINEEEINPNTDIFSLGIVAYELLTGSHPFKADSLDGIRQRITHEVPIPLKEYRTDVPEGLVHILNKMLVKQSYKRYASGFDLASDLALVFDGLEIMESGESLLEKFDSLKDLGFFKDFDDAEIWGVVRASNWLNFTPGETIIKEGDNEHSFYIILSGIVKIEKNGHLLHTLQDGDCFGEIGFLSKANRTASAITKTPVSLIRVNASTLDRADESTQLRFLKVLSTTLVERLKQTTDIVAQLKQV